MSASPKISSFTIIVTFLCVALAGIAFIPLLPIKLSPSRTLPQLTISYNMPGNSARVIEMEVTSRLEAMLARTGRPARSNHVRQRMGICHARAGQAYQYRCRPFRSVYHHPTDMAQPTGRTELSGPGNEPAGRQGSTAFHELHTECGSHTHIYTTLCRRPNKTSPKRDSRHLPHRRQRCHPDGMATGI